jgi:hypothetical protein
MSPYLPFHVSQLNGGTNISSEFQKAENQFLEIGLQTLPPNFFKNQILEVSARNQF